VGHLDATRALLEAGADVNERLPDGMSALVLAVYNAHYELASVLLERIRPPPGPHNSFAMRFRKRRTRYLLTIAIRSCQTSPPRSRGMHFQGRSHGAAIAVAQNAYVERVIGSIRRECLEVGGCTTATIESTRSRRPAPIRYSQLCHPSVQRI
jgi:Ankyrin repeats (many copies)